MDGPSIREGYIPVPGGRAWYRIDDSKGGIPLFALHGGPGTSSGYFEPLINLSDDRPVILYDHLDGSNGLDADPAHWDLGCCVEKLHQVCDVLGLQTIHLLGYGWGTILALDFALAYPECLASLILDPLDPAGLVRHFHWVAEPAGRGMAALQRLAEMRAPKLFIWEGDPLGSAGGAACNQDLLPGWELSALRPTLPRSYAQEHGRFTDLVRGFLNRVEHIGY